MTVAMLREAGVSAETSPTAGESVPDTWRVHPGPVAARRTAVQPDLVNAVPFLAAALITGGTVTIAGWPATTTQPAAQIVDLLTRLGGTCELTPGGLTVTGTGVIHGITADLADVNETALVATALAALADAPSRLTGIGHMRQQETDRLAAIATEIGALGGDVEQLPDGLAIRPRPLAAGGRPFASYDDHRLVMAGAVLGLAVPGIEVANPATVGKTFPEFRQLWTSMLECPP
jgi:3-phosphoshikimate 1-carboxyvinyltransferase